MGVVGRDTVRVHIIHKSLINNLTTHLYTPVHRDSTGKGFRNLNNWFFIEGFVFMTYQKNEDRESIMCSNLSYTDMYEELFHKPITSK